MSYCVLLVPINKKLGEFQTFFVRSNHHFVSTTTYLQVYKVQTMASRPRQDELAMMSVTKEVCRQDSSIEHPSDLVTRMLNDTEQSPESTSTGSESNAFQQHHSQPSGPVSFDLKQLAKGLVKLDQSKWKPSVTAIKCADPKCRRRFTSVVTRRRNCSMCGEVFCRSCINFRRKLSVNAKPDPLGTFFQVCETCFNLKTTSATCRDLMREFSNHRRPMIDRKQSAVSTDLRNPLCVQKSSALKRISIKSEVKKLVKGYEDNSGLIKGFLSEVKVPAWQKLPQWVDSSKSTACFGCGGQFGNLLSGRFKKINCRIGGQVFCSNCCTDEMVLYSSEGEIKWAVNGKPGAPSTPPSSYKLLPVCNSCSSDLQEIVQERVAKPVPTVTTSAFLEKLHLMHQKLSQLAEKIETTLPEYMTIVDSLDMTDNSPKSIGGQNPLQVLVKVQTDLSDAFSSLAVRSQKLKHLKPESDTESRLHRHVMIGTYQYYSENMFQFRLTKNRLCELMPTDHLEEIQLDVSQRSMERVHVYLKQLMFELLDLKKRYKYQDDFFEPIMATILNAEDELKPFLESRNESWEKQTECALDFIRGELEAGRRALTVNTDDSDPVAARYVVMSQISSRVHECYRELQAKTIDREFCKTKESVRDAFVTLDGLLTTK